MSFFERFKEICTQRGTTPNKVVSELGYSNSICSVWKKSGNPPRPDKLKEISNYFGVSPDYFYDIDYDKLQREVGSLDDQPYKRIIPIFESVSAGLGINASDYIIGYESISIRSDKEASETIGIKVKGFSMYPEIKDGDIIIVHKQPECENKKIAVVRVDDSYYVKQFIKEDDKIILHSINPEYQDREFVGDDMNKVIIIGIVTRQIRNWK